MSIARFFFVLCLVASLTGGASAQSSGPVEKVLIRARKPHSSLVAAIETRGGKVTWEYNHIDALAADVPRSALAGIRSLVGQDAVSKDSVIPAPAPFDTLVRQTSLPRTGEEGRILADSAQVIDAASIASFAAANPAAYLINNSIMNVSAIHAAGLAGAGVVVAVIDSGIRPGFPHISLDGSVIGGEDFVGDGLGAINPANNGHGTFVAGMISANVIFSFNPASTLFRSIQAHAPGAIIGPNLVPMIGTAPLSSIYALRVFGPTGGAPTSRVIAAMDRAIELRQKFNAGQPGGVNIRVCNMSLGGPTLFAGRDLIDLVADALLANDIVPAIAAGNAGPSSLTTGSPASSISSLTVGAANFAHNERILRDLQFGLGIGALWRPSAGAQTAYFSSRGPNADGRPDPDVVANGFGCFGQGTGTPLQISLGSGTSFSTPSTAGVAALLRQGFPSATARQIRNAIVAGANPAFLSDGSTELDQGSGLVNGVGAFNLLAAGAVPDTLPPAPKFHKSVAVNVEKNTSLNVYNGLVNQNSGSLKPGQRRDILYRIHPNTSQVLITLSGFSAALPPPQQNQLFGDDILLTIHSGKTSDINDGDYKHFVFTTGGTFAVNDPETGLLRVTVNGDWTNAGTVAGTISIVSLTDPLPQFTEQGKIDQSELLVFPISVPAGVTKAEFRTIWREDWSNYPASDVDMILVSPSSGLNFSGATLNNPEGATIMNPQAGTWLVILVASDIPSGSDKFELRVALDGKVVK